MTGSTSDSLVSAPPELGPHHPLGPAERDALRALQAAQDWPAAYRQIAIYAEQNKKITPQVANWLRTAADINQNIGPYAAYVRSEGVLAWARNGKILAPEKFQQVSNELGARVTQHVLDYGLPERANDVLAQDVARAVKDFQLKPSEWAGATANGLTSFDQIAPVWLNHVLHTYFRLPPLAQVDSVPPLGDLAKRASSWFFDLPYVDIGLYEGSMFGAPPASGGKDGPATGNKTFENGTKVTADDAQWGAAGRWGLGALRQSEAANLQKQLPSLGDKAAYLHPYYISRLWGKVFVPGQLWSPLLHRLMPNATIEKMTDTDKKNWEAFKSILVQHPEIAQASSLGAVKPEGAAQSYLVSEKARAFINLIEVTTQTPEEAVKRQQMASVRARRGASRPEPGNPLPVFTPPEPLLTPAPIPVPQDGGREGRAAQPHPALAFDVPTPPAFNLPALPSKEQMGIDLAFAPPPTLVVEAEGAQRVPQRIERPPAPAPDDAPVTLRQLQDLQEALLLDLREAMMNRPAPEIDILALRRQLRREDYLDVLAGRTIHSYP